MPSLLGLEPRALLQSVLDNVGVALAVIDREGKIAFTNQAALDMFGMKESLAGVSLAEWRRKYVFHDSHEREIPAAQLPILHALAGEEVKPQEIRVTLPDGRRKWLHVAGHGFSILGLRGILLIITDETEQVGLRLTAERCQRTQAIGVLAGGLAHDFNNMLSVISENVALSLAEPDVLAVTRNRLQNMALALEKGSALAKRLVQFSRAETTRTRSLDVNEAVNTALELALPLVGHGVRVKTDLARDLPTVKGDPVEIEQALVNLILNALDAMPKGGELTLHTGIEFEDPPSAGKNRRTQPFILISVADTGIGIPENLQESIFDPFFTTKSESKGVGLGLSSAYGIVHHHHGHIKVQSAPGRGTKFSIYLPVEKEAATSTEKAV